MNAKKSIKRAEARYFHINNDFNREAQMSNFVTNMCSYDDPDYNWINEHNQRQHDLVQYLNDLSGKAESELYHLRNLPWYRKLWIA